MRRTTGKKQKSPKLIKVHTSDEHGCKGCFFERISYTLRMVFIRMKFGTHISQKIG